MSNAISVIPIGYDVMWIGEQLGQDFTGWVARADGVHVVYPNEKFEEMAEIINTYPVRYLAKAVPIKFELIAGERDKHIQGFSFEGLNIVLDDKTKINIAGACLGLDRNPSVKFINWSLGGGVFVPLSRAIVYGIADASFAHIQACFNNHKKLVDQARAAKNIKALDAIDITAGWPS